MELLAGLVLSLTAAVVGAWQITRRDRPLHGPIDDGTLGLPRIQRWDESYHPPRFQRLRSQFPRFELSRLGIVLFIILLVAGGAFALYTRSVSQNASREDRFSVGISRVNQHTAEARSVTDPAVAYTALVDARAELDRLAPLASDDTSRDEVAALRGTIDTALADLSVSTPVVGTQIIGNYPAAPAGVVPQVITAGGRLFMLSDAVYEIDPINSVLVQLLKPGDVVSDAPVLVPRALTWREDRLMVIDATRAYTLDSSTGQWQAQSLSTPDTAGYVNTIAAEAFDGNLYLLMPADGKILKFPADAYGATPEDWVGTVAKEDLKSAVDFAVDGHVYVLLRDGRVLDFLRSRLKTTFAPAIIPPLSNATSIVAEPNQAFIYLLHGPDGRILRLTRDGALTQQITAGDAADRLRGAIGLTVDEEKSIAYVLTETSVVTVRLPAPPASSDKVTPTAGETR